MKSGDYVAFECKLCLQSLDEMKTKFGGWRGESLF